MRLIVVCLLALGLFVANGEAQIKGVKKSDESKYSGATITCADPVSGVRTIPISLLNDDYCDCPYDGADEPATGACQAGKFYCQNKGWRGKYVFASAVNDGVCDCCDGSDEWKSGACANVCEELGKASTIHLEEKLNKLLNGLKIRNELINDANVSRKEREERKIQLESTFAERQAIVDSLKIKVEEEEKLEKEENDKREKAAAEAAAANQAATQQTNPDGTQTNDATTAATADATNPPSDATSSTPPSPATPSPPSPDTVAVSGGDDEDEEGGTRFTRKRKNDKKNKKVDVVEAQQVGEPGGATPTAVTGEEKIEAEVAAFPYPAEYAYQPNAVTNQEAAERLIEEKEEEEEDEAEAAEEAREAAAQSGENNQYVSEAAKQARAALDAAEKKLERTRVKLEEAKNLLETDFGVDNQYFSLYKACFSLNHKQYTYEMCPYEDAKQKEHGSTSLGTWAGHKIKEVNGKNINVFSFVGGQGCWQGPSRSLDVHLTCGDSNKPLSVEEPSKCVYLMQFESPTVCSEEEINALKQEIAAAKQGTDE